MKTENDRSSNTIGRKLRDEAMADSPSFSPLLHARIMQKIQSEQRLGPAPHSWRIGWIASSIAAAVLFAMTLWSLNHRPIKPPVATVKSPSIPQLAIQFPNLSERANSSLSQARYGYLDRDAKAAANYVMNQFDIVPSPPARRG